MRLIKEEKMIVRIYDSFLEMRDDAHEKAKQTPRNLHPWTTLSDKGFTGAYFRDWQHLIQMSQTPREEDVKTFNSYREMLRKKTIQPANRKRKRSFNDMGEGEIDVDRIMSQDPAFWNETKKANTKGAKTVTILLNIAISCDTSAEMAFKKCAATLALVDFLEEAGVMVEVLAYGYSKEVRSGEQSEDLVVFPIKQSGEPLVVSSALTALSIWWHRVVHFTTFHGYGRVYEWYGLPQKKEEWQKFPQHFETESSTVLHMPSVAREELIVETINNMIKKVEGIE